MSSEDSLQDTGGLKWIADHDTKNSALFHAMFDSPEVSAYRLQEVENKATKAEQTAIKASNDAAMANEKAERCNGNVVKAQDYVRMSKAINADIERYSRLTRIFTTISVVCNFLVLVIVVIWFLSWH